VQWNVIVTTLPGRPRFLAALEGLRRMGEFRATAFRDVCLGRVEDARLFLEALLAARSGGERWALAVARAIPVEQTFSFTAETFVAQLESALAPLAARMAGGSFHLRLERRGLAETLPSDRIEREVADHLYSLAEARDVALHTSFHDPDYVLVAETVGTECGVALLPRALRERFPFVAAR